jgi:superfamily II DNA or RNA helicase
LVPDNKQVNVQLALRPYQEQCVQNTLTAWESFGRLLGVAPTGSGKTRVFSAIAKSRLSTGRVLILAHRDELLDQAIEKLDRDEGILADKEKAEERASLESDVVVASVQSLRNGRLSRFPRDHFQTVVCDEAHRSLADSYQAIFDHFSSAKVLGVTATPDRGDQRDLGQFYQEIAFEVGLKEMIDQAYLARIKVETIPLQIDLGNIDTVAGDFRDDQLGHAIEPYLERIVDALIPYKERKVLVFLPLVALSERFSQISRENGIKAEHIDGNSPDRKEILQRFSSGETRLLSNAMLLTEGYDEPSIDTVVCLRPTRSRPLYAQMVGRGTRTHPGKDHLLLLDFLWLSQKHSLIRPAHLLAFSQDEAEHITQALEEANGDLTNALEISQEKEIAEKLAERLRDNRHKQRRTYDAVDLAVALKSSRLLNYGARMSWQADGATENQKSYLAHEGVDPSTVRDKGHAEALIEVIKQRSNLNLASLRQLFWLEHEGYPNAHKATFAEAGCFLTKRWGNPRSLRANITALNREFSNVLSSGRILKKDIDHSAGLERYKTKKRLDHSTRVERGKSNHLEAKTKSSGKREWLVRKTGDGRYVYREVDDRGRGLFLYSSTPVLQSERIARQCLAAAGGESKATVYRKEVKSNA